MKASRFVCASATLALAAGGACAQTSNEFWPELDSWLKLNDTTRLMLRLDSTRDSDSGDRTNGEGGLYVDYRFSDRIAFRAGYLYSDTPPTTPGAGHSVEHRWNLDFSYNWMLNDTTKLTNRLRTDLRDIAGVSSYRIRDRVKVEHEAHWGRQAVTPYAHIEAFYDSRFDTVSRYRLQAGATTRLSNDIEIDLYAGRQRDTAPADKYVNGIGLTLNLYF
jgi:hypothetical protein